MERGTPHLAGPHHSYLTASLKSKSSALLSPSSSVQPISKSTPVCQQACLQPHSHFTWHLKSHHLASVVFGCPSPKLLSSGTSQTSLISCIWLSFTKASILRFESESSVPSCLLLHLHAKFAVDDTDDLLSTIAGSGLAICRLWCGLLVILTK